MPSLMMPAVVGAVDDMSELKVSALTNAAKISHLITETTIGPQSTTSSIIDNDPQTKILDSVAVGSDYKTASKWNRDVWRVVENHPLHRPQELNLNDCKRIRFQMAQSSAEKVRIAQVRKKLAERQSKIDEMDMLSAKMRIMSIEQAAQNIQQNIRKREEQFREAIRQIEISAKQMEVEAQRELAEHEKQKVERSIRFQREQERLEHLSSIKSFKNLFILVFERFVKTLLTNQQDLIKCNEYVQQKEFFLSRYEIIMKTVNSGQITANEVAVLEQLCDDIKAIQQQIDEEIARNDEDLKQNTSRQEQNVNVKAPVTIAPEQPVQQKEECWDTVDDAQYNQTIVAKSSILTQFVHPDRLVYYENIMKFMVHYEQSVKPLESDEKLNKFRFNCKKAVNIPLNSICAKSSQHLQDKFDKVALVLFGSSLKVGDVQFSSAEHPLGVKYCTMLVAKRFVNLADTEISSNPLAAFPMAAILVAFWQKFPDVGKLFLAYLYKECPYLVPYYIPQLEGHSNDDYLKLIGYRHNESGALENQEHYLKRMSGLVRLYSAVLISKSRRSQASIANPHDIDNGWIWLTNMLNLDPLPDVSATLIQEFLATTGADMWKQYGKQFIKILVILHRSFMDKLNKIDEGGPKARLEVLLNKIFEENKISPPDGVLSSNFW